MPQIKLTDDLLNRFNAVAGQALQHGSATKQGWGRIGMIGGRVFKFNTHYSQYSKDSRDCMHAHRFDGSRYSNGGEFAREYDQMRASCEALRTELVDLTRALYGVGTDEDWSRNVPSKVLKYLEKIGVEFPSDEDGNPELSFVSLEDRLIDRSAVGKWVLAVKEDVAKNGTDEGVKDRVAKMKGVGSYKFGKGSYADVAGFGSGKACFTTDGCFHNAAAGYKAVYESDSVGRKFCPIVLQPSKSDDWDGDKELKGIVQNFLGFGHFSVQGLSRALATLCSETAARFVAYEHGGNENAKCDAFVKGLIDRLKGRVDLESLKTKIDEARESQSLGKSDKKILERYSRAIGVAQQEAAAKAERKIETVTPKIKLASKDEGIEEPINRKFIVNYFQACFGKCTGNVSDLWGKEARVNDLWIACDKLKDDLTEAQLLKGILSLSDKDAIDRKDLLNRAAEKFLEGKVIQPVGTHKLNVCRLIAANLEKALNEYAGGWDLSKQDGVDIHAVAEKFNKYAKGEVELEEGDVRELLDCVFDRLFDDCYPYGNASSIGKIESSFTVQSPDEGGDGKTHALTSKITPVRKAETTNLAFSKLEDEGGKELVSFVRCGNHCVQGEGVEADDYYRSIAEAAVLGKAKNVRNENGSVNVDLFQIDLSGDSSLSPKNDGTPIAHTINGTQIRVNVKRISLPIDSRNAKVDQEAIAAEVDRLVGKSKDVADKADLATREKISYLINSINRFVHDMPGDTEDLGPQLIQFGAQMAMLAHLVGETPLVHCHVGKDRTSLMDAEIKHVATDFHFAHESLGIRLIESEEDKARNTEFVKRTGNLEAAISMDKASTYTPLLNQSGGHTKLYNHYRVDVNFVKRPDGAMYAKPTLNFKFDHKASDGIRLVEDNKFSIFNDGKYADVVGQCLDVLLKNGDKEIIAGITDAIGNLSAEEEDYLHELLQKDSGRNKRVYEALDDVAKTQVQLYAERDNAVGEKAISVDDKGTVVMSLLQYFKATAFTDLIVKRREDERNLYAADSGDLAFGSFNPNVTAGKDYYAALLKKVTEDPVFREAFGEDFAMLDSRLEGLREDLDRLEGKLNKSAADLEDIFYLQRKIQQNQRLVENMLKEHVHGKRRDALKAVGYKAISTSGEKNDCLWYSLEEVLWEKGYENPKALREKLIDEIKKQEQGPNGYGVGALSELSGSLEDGQEVNMEVLKFLADLLKRPIKCQALLARGEKGAVTFAVEKKDYGTEYDGEPIVIGFVESLSNNGGGHFFKLEKTDLKKRKE